MMRILLFLLTLLPASVFAQSPVSIVSSDFASVNDTVRLSTANLLTVDTSWRFSGTNQTWDMRNLEAVSQRLDTFVAVSSTPITYQALFNLPLFNPRANLAVQADVIDSIAGISVSNVYTYFKNTSAGWVNAGFGGTVAGVPVPITTSPVDTQFVFPVTFNQTRSYNTGFTLNVPGVVYFNRTETRADTVDGWGTLRLPIGDFPVLRVKSTVAVQDTFNVTGVGARLPARTVERYYWLGKNEEIPLVTAQAERLFGISALTSVTYQDTFQNLLCRSFVQNSSVNSTDVTCAVCTDGEAWVNPLLGRPPYSISWSPGGSTNDTISNLAPGDYIVTVVDDTGCVYTDTATIQGFDCASFQVSASGTDVTCFGCQDGTASVTPTGGTLPYTYSWAPTADTTAALNGLAPGQYIVTVLDSVSCTRRDTVIVEAFQCPAYLLNTAVKDASCPTCPDGRVVVTPQGGTPPYRYDWLGRADSTDTLANLLPGLYTVAVLDSFNCPSGAIATVGECPGFGIEATALAADTSGLCTGSASVQVTGGTAPYAIAWSTMQDSNLAVADSLCADSIIVTVTDTLGCFALDTVVIDAVIGRLTVTGEPTLNIVVYPNPIERGDILYLQNLNESGYQDLVLRLVGADGRFVRATTRSLNANGSATWNLDDLPAGLYFLHLNTQAGTATYRLLVE